MRQKVKEVRRNRGIFFIIMVCRRQGHPFDVPTQRAPDAQFFWGWSCEKKKA
jgi:hypothetical protein